MGKSNNKFHIVGLMSGTSLDGIDAALLELEDDSGNLDVKVLHFISVPYSQEIRNRIGHLCNPEIARVDELSAMNVFLGECLAEAVTQVVREAEFTLDEIDLICSHGQTVFHQPEPVQIGGRQITSTLQIGELDVVAERTGVTTVGDFRTKDMAAGGQGAPLVPYTDYLLFSHKKHGRILLNIGGISNITILPPGCNESDVMAYDTGPGNMLIDTFMEWGTRSRHSYDKDGAVASEGQVDEQWLSRLLDHPYYKKETPKSTGREMFGTSYASKLWDEAEERQISFVDRVATLTALTAQSIANSIKTSLTQGGRVNEILVSGGGRYNKTLMANLKDALPSTVDLQGTETLNLSSDAKEAVAFGILGYQSMCGRYNTLQTATGASKPVVMGKVSRGGKRDFIRR